MRRFLSGRPPSFSGALFGIAQREPTEVRRTSFLRRCWPSTLCRFLSFSLFSILLPLPLQNATNRLATSNRPPPPPPPAAPTDTFSESYFLLSLVFRFFGPESRQRFRLSSISRPLSSRSRLARSFNPSAGVVRDLVRGPRELRFRPRRKLRGRKYNAMSSFMQRLSRRENSFAASISITSASDLLCDLFSTHHRNKCVRHDPSIL